MRKISLFVLSLFAIVSIAVADTTTTVTNRGNVITVKTLGDTSTDTKDLDIYQDYSTYPGKPGEVGRIVRFYDFDVMGGKASVSHKLLPVVKIKDNVVVRNGYVDVMTAVAPIATTTNGLLLNAADDVLATGTNLLNVSGAYRAIVPVGTAATILELTADRYLCFTNGPTAITSGKFMVVLDVEMAP